MRIDLLLANTVATFAFAVLFQAPKREYFFCAATGAIASLGYLFFEALGIQAASMTAIIWAAFFLMVAARAFSVLRRCPVTVYLLPGIIPLVNGMGIYQMAQALIAGDLTLGASKGLNALKISVSIALGIGFAFAIPDRWFKRLGRRK